MANDVLIRIQGVKVIYDNRIGLPQVEDIVKEECSTWSVEKKCISRIVLVVDNEKDEIVVHTQERSPIRRIRRITGYLSNLDNFGDAKLVEQSERWKHCKMNARLSQVISDTKDYRNYTTTYREKDVVCAHACISDNDGNVYCVLNAIEPSACSSKGKCLYGLQVIIDKVYMGWLGCDKKEMEV